MSKPKISYDRDAESFEQDGKQITRAQARARWYALDSEWTKDANCRMVEIINYLEPYSLSGGRDA